MSEALDLVVAGNLLVDDLVHHDGATRMGEPGGGALYVSLAAALWGVKVGLVSLLGNDYPAHAMDALRQHAVDLDGVKRLDGPSLRTWLLYEKAGRQIVRQLANPSHASVSPGLDEFPRRYLDARFVHVCPTPFDVQRPLVLALANRAPARLSVDPHETVRADNLDAWAEVFARIDTFFVSHEELLLGGAVATPEERLRALRGHRPHAAVLLKCGAEGGVALDVRTDRLHPWRSRADRAVDTTGAGDAFAGGVLAGRIRGEAWEPALQRGVVSASFAIESWGPAALIAATPAAAERRRLEWFGGVPA